jgi:ABC-2 type transport system permease protein
MSNYLINYTLFKKLLRAKLTNIRSELIEKTINIYVWAGCSLFVMGYIMQSFGLAKGFGPFQLAGILASIGLFELYGNTCTLIADIEGDRTIAYYLTLPASAITVLFSYIAHWLIITMSVSIALLPLGKLILWNQLNLANVAWGKLLIFIFVVNFMFAALSLVFSAYLPSIEKLGIIWCRIIFPMWFLGGFQFSWAATHTIAPLFSYVMLIDPVTYATEGMRAVLLGQSEYLSFWICLLVMTALSCLSVWWSVKALKQRLDFV